MYERRFRNRVKQFAIGTIFSVIGAAGIMGCSPSVETETIAKHVKVTAVDYRSNWLNVRIIEAAKPSSPNLILIPGLVSSSHTWDGIVDDLSKTHRLHLVDISGFAGMAPTAALDKGVIDGLVADLAEYIKTKELRQVTIMGHSLGGFTALNEALRHGDLLERIVIVDSLPFYSALFNPDAIVETTIPMAEGMRSQIQGLDDKGFEAMQKRTVQIMSKDKTAQADILSWSLASDRATMAQATYELMTTDLRDKLDQISTPTHVIYAWDEAMRVPVSHIENIYKTQYAGLENVQLIRIDDSFHFIMKDQPQAFLSAVQAALAAQ